MNEATEQEAESLWDYALPMCPTLHYNAEVTVGELGDGDPGRLVRMRCPDCLMHAFASLDSARLLGWIE